MYLGDILYLIVILGDAKIAVVKHITVKKIMCTIEYMFVLPLLLLLLLM